MKGRSATHLALLGALLFTASLWLSATAAPALAATPAWQFNSVANTSAEPGTKFDYIVEAANVGDASTDGSTVTMAAKLPPGITAIEALWVENDAGVIAECTAGNGVDPALGASEVLCTMPTIAVRSRGSIAYTLVVTVAPGASPGPVMAEFEISGGGAPSSTTVDPTLIGPSPGFGIDAFDAAITANQANAPSTQAAGHPYANATTIGYNTGHNSQPLKDEVWPVEATKDVFVELPPGQIGSAVGAPTCSLVDLSHTTDGGGQADKPLCSPDSQVGTILLRGDLFGRQRVNSTTYFGPNSAYGPFPLYNLVPAPGEPARFGIVVFGTVVVLDAEVRSSGDYGLTVASRDVPTGFALANLTTTFWGVPADESHRFDRGCPNTQHPMATGETCPSSVEPRPFLRNPTACTATPHTGLPTTLRVDSWFHPGVFKESTFLSHEAPGFPYPREDWGEEVGITGCASVPFEPTISVQPTTDKADSPTGLNVDLTMPQSCWEAKPTVAEVEAAGCQADLKDASVTQPVGMRVNPATADGLTGCSEAQIGFIGAGFPMPNPTHFTSAQPNCPDSSKIGTVEIQSPLLPDKLEGAIYQARQDENPFGATLAFYAVADADGVMIKLPAEVKTDPATGQVTTIFRDSPQLPFEHYKLHFFGGSRAPLITPPTCGEHTTDSTYTGWANPGEPVHTEDSFQITEGANGTPCPNGEAGRPFQPSFEAGTQSPTAGAFSPFVLKLGREDGMQEFTGLETTLPPGLLGKLAGIPYCPDAALAAAEHTGAAAERATPSCPAASMVGVTDAAAGAGPTPFHNPGTAYLAGPYKGAPLSLAIITPALAGPLDLGTVVVRVALRVDPTTAQVTAVSDPLPSRILAGGDGFPLDLRQITVHMNRPEFIRNPTSCEPMAVTGTIGGANGASAAVSSRFQAAGCETLPFRPRTSIHLSGKTRRGGFPALRAVVLDGDPKEANVARAVVSLPHSEFVAQSHLNHVCTRVQYAADGGGGAGCPAGSTYGHAVVYTPLLDQPLEGPVYLRANGGERALPDLVLSLGGQIHVDLVGFVDSNKKTGGIRTTFASVPDAFVSKFVLSMQGGKKGLLENSTDICRGTHEASVDYTAHNGKTLGSQVPLQARCPKRKSAGKKHPKR